MDTWIPASPCPNCKKIIDGATSVGGERSPGPGDFGICLYCAGLHRYDDEMRLRALQEGELESLPPDAQQYLLRLQKAMEHSRAMVNASKN